MNLLWSSRSSFGVSTPPGLTISWHVTLTANKSNKLSHISPRCVDKIHVSWINSFYGSSPSLVFWLPSVGLLFPNPSLFSPSLNWFTLPPSPLWVLAFPFSDSLPASLSLSLSSEHRFFKLTLFALDDVFCRPRPSEYPWMSVNWCCITTSPISRVHRGKPKQPTGWFSPSEEVSPSVCQNLINPRTPQWRFYRLWTDPIAPSLLLPKSNRGSSYIAPLPQWTWTTVLQPFQKPSRLILCRLALCGWAAKADDSFVCFGAKPDKGFLDLKSCRIRKWEGDAKESWRRDPAERQLTGDPYEGGWRWTGERQLALDSREASSRELAWNHGQGQSTPDTGAERRGSMG